MWSSLWWALFFVFHIKNFSLPTLSQGILRHLPLIVPFFLMPHTFIPSSLFSSSLHHHHHHHKQQDIAKSHLCFLHFQHFLLLRQWRNPQSLLLLVMMVMVKLRRTIVVLRMRRGCFWTLMCPCKQGASLCWVSNLDGISGLEFGCSIVGDLWRWVARKWRERSF